jgi:predicted  nucleic acid-binding Zn-ribbon protein
VKVLPELERLISLQQIDTKIRTLRRNIETANQRRIHLEKEFDNKAGEIREVQLKRKEANDQRIKLEAKINDIKSKIQRAERNLRIARNQKEYEAAVRELDVLQKQLSSLEVELLDKMVLIEEADKFLNERAEEISKLESERKEALENFEKQLEQDKAQLEISLKKRQEVFTSLPTNITRIYTRLIERSSDGIAVAEVINESCSSCFMKLRPQVMMELRRAEKIVTCESCTRILYITKAEIKTSA